MMPENFFSVPSGETMPPGNSSDSDRGLAPSALSSDTMGGVGVHRANIVFSEGSI